MHLRCSGFLNRLRVRCLNSFEPLTSLMHLVFLQTTYELDVLVFRCFSIVLLLLVLSCLVAEKLLVKERNSKFDL